MKNTGIDFNNIDVGLDEVSLSNKHELVFKKVDVKLLDENPYNNEIYEVDEEADEFLKDDIGRNGITNPIIIKKSDIHANRYEIVSGHRRTRIAKQLGMHEIEAREIIARTEEEKAFAAIMLITANSTQRDRKPSEKAKEIQYLKTKIQKCNIDNVAKWISSSIKMSERNVYRYEKLASQPKDVQDAVDRGEISVKQAIGEEVVNKPIKKNKDTKKSIDANKTAKKVYSLVCSIDSVNNDSLDNKAVGYLKECVEMIESILS